MSIKLRYFNVPEAEALLPPIIELLSVGQEIKVKIEQKIEEWRKKHDNLTPAEEAVLRGQVDFMASRLENVLGEIAEMGCIPKDLDVGLIDFPTRIDGKEGYLCWKLGEKHITHWHNLTDGFSGRKKIKETRSV
jgi:hypothetical protein